MMKTNTLFKNLVTGLALACSFGLASNVFATTCGGAISLGSSLPSNQALTCGGGNDLTSTNTASCGSSSYKGGQEALYTFNPANTGSYTISISGQTWTGIFVYDGCPTSGGVCVGSVTSSSSSKTLTVSLNAGGNYYLWFDTWPSPISPCPGTFSITASAPLPNPCNNISSLSCGGSKTFSLNGSGAGWTGNGPFSTPGAEAVFSFTPTSSGVHTFNVSHTGGYYVDLFFRSTACGPSGWTYLDDILGSASVTVSLTAGTTYLFLIDDEDTNPTSGTISLSCPSSLPCNTASTISCGQTVTGTTVGGATTPGLPTCSGISVGTGGHRWYKFTGNGSIVTASMCSPNTTYDSKLHVYSGSCASPVCVTADDDACTTPGLASTVTFCAQNGVTYYILVNGFGSAEGNYSLSIDCNQPATINPVGPLCLSSTASLSGTPAGGIFAGPGVTGNSFSAATAGVGTHTITYLVCNTTATSTVTVLAPPANDLCGNAVSVSAGNSYIGTTSCAGVDGGLTFCGTSGGTAPGVWYSFTGDGNRWKFETCNTTTNYDSKLHAFSGSCGALSCVAGNDDIGGTCTQTGGGSASFKSEIEFCTQIGVQYYVLVHGFSSASGNFELEVTSTPGPSVNAGSNQIVYGGYAGAPSCANLTAVGAGGTGPYTYAWSNGATTASISVCPTSTTDYTVTVTDANGCQGSDVVRVCYVELACARNKVAICHIPPGNPSNAQTLCISASAVSSHIGNHGDYYGPCGSNVCEDDQIAPAKAGSASFDADLNATPNPFRGATTISFSNNVDERVTVKVYNMLGAEIATLFEGMMAAGETKEINFRPNTAAGMYMVKMMTESGNSIVKRVVME